jgi:hypothetical protein
MNHSLIKELVTGTVIGVIVGAVTAMGTSYVQISVLDQRLGQIERTVERLATERDAVIRLEVRLSDFERRLAACEERRP